MRSGTPRLDARKCLLGEGLEEAPSLLAMRMIAVAEWDSILGVT
jgi:hypothetical protein